MAGPATPPLGHLVELLGLVDALRLVARRGGIAVYVPHGSRLQLHHKLAEEIGLEAAKKLAAEYPSTNVIVPRGAAYLRRQRDRALLADVKQMSVSQAARKYEMTERNVYMLLERGLEGMPELPGSSDSQGDFFEENA